MKKTFQILILIFLGFILPIMVLADIAPISGSCEWYCEDTEARDPPEDQVCICNPLGADTFEDIINNIIDFIFNIALVLAPLMIVWAGGLYITSSGNPDQITKAKNIIIYTLVGFAIILLSKGFVAIIKQLLGTSET